MRPQLDIQVALTTAHHMWGGDGVREVTRGVFQSAPDGALIALIGSSPIPRLAVDAARGSCPTFSSVLVRIGMGTFDVSPPRHSLLAEEWDEEALRMVEKLGPSDRLLQVEVWTADTEADAAAMLLASPYIRSALTELNYEVSDEAVIRDALEEVNHEFLHAYDSAIASELRSIGEAA